mmetsp:Transcript_1741/g.3614  ORF Transcript_1741/g.3614 Transcript_1741/m.3614 type:complete len:317 (-) Transcript_1741:1114-2064(-)
MTRLNFRSFFSPLFTVHQHSRQGARKKVLVRSREWRERGHSSNADTRERCMGISLKKRKKCAAFLLFLLFLTHLLQPFLLRIPSGRNGKNFASLEDVTGMQAGTHSMHFSVSVAADTTTQNFKNFYWLARGPKKRKTRNTQSYKYIRWAGRQTFSFPLPKKRSFEKPCLPWPDWQVALSCLGPSEVVLLLNLGGRADGVDGGGHSLRGGGVDVLSCGLGLKGDACVVEDLHELAVELCPASASLRELLVGRHAARAAHGGVHGGGGEGRVEHLLISLKAVHRRQHPLEEGDRLLSVGDLLGQGLGGVGSLLEISRL